MSDMITLTIDGQKVTAPAGSTILEAAKLVGIDIPTLCHHPLLRPEGACRVCVCKVTNARSFLPACIATATEGMEVFTHDPEVLEARKNIVELLLANHPKDCLACARSGNCELQTVANNLGIRKVRYEYNRPEMELDTSNPCLVRDPSKCILCGRCVRMCAEVQGTSIYSFAYRGLNARVTPAFNMGLGEVACTFCGQCRKVCPTAAITFRSDTERAWEALRDPEKIVMVQTAPSVRVAISEPFGGKPGDLNTGQMVSALRRLGFDKVFDTNWAADLTIMEEGTELIGRVTKGGKLPMITSCSPGWINFVELNYPDLLENLSTAKSPQSMFGAMLKTYYAKKEGLDPSKIVSVSIMPCTAKKFEAFRRELSASGYPDTDIVLTTTELAQMIKEANIKFMNLPEEQFDPIMGEGSGAGTIFGATGGVMEAAVRTAYKIIVGEEMEPMEVQAVRGLEGIKEAEVDFGGKVTLKVAIAHGLANARKVCELIRAGNPNGWHFIEIMACPGGCINGGGQPINMDADTPRLRAEALYRDDAGLPIRRSHENAEVQALYRDFLGEPNSHKAHELLHTHYYQQSRICKSK